ncbi:CLUMA_CG003988, isoform A [Clunio marinus]|uniref:CLUMA_CG003988, isoform A n=1 Tax=Clunio marinus TaxID=568069 RepID=A0A1J1HS69_9DIPT|nr:CLUMA_CG003988, isoform A [Clunio marinus]
MFKRRANEIFAELTVLIPDHNFELELNSEGKPKRGSFEIHIIKAGSDKKIEIWSGLNRGPPRKEKFPTSESLVPIITKAIN